MSEIEPHKSKSKLEPFLGLIIEMRSKEWPYRKILEYLKKEKKVIAAYKTLYTFCKIRGIKKGSHSSYNNQTVPPRKPQEEESIEDILGEETNPKQQNPFTKL